MPELRTHDAWCGNDSVADRGTLERLGIRPTGTRTFLLADLANSPPTSMADLAIVNNKTKQNGD